MKTVGLITEYNPFHKGHEYHIKEAKKLCNADCAVVIMSGNFVQRGEPAFADKYTRTQIALHHGADLVLELPLIYATASAEAFANGAVSILDKLGCVDSLCFGAEHADTDTLLSIAKILLDEPEIYKNKLKEELKNGAAFPGARAKALQFYTAISKDLQNQETIFEILNFPNNILGIEYCKVLLSLNSSIRPAALKRIHSGYHSSSTDDRFYSATALRSLYQTNLCQETLAEIDTAYLNNFGKSYPLYATDFSFLLGERLLQLSKSHMLTEILDINPDLANAIENNLPRYSGWESFLLQLKHKNYTYSRISRCLTHILLDIRKSLAEEAFHGNTPDYIRVLGFNQTGRTLLSEIKKKSGLKILTRISRYQELLCDSYFSMAVFEQNLAADARYRMAAMLKYQSCLPDEFTQKLLVHNTELSKESRIPL